MNVATLALIRGMSDQEYVAVPPHDQRRVESRLVQHSPWQEQEIELVLFNGHYLAVRDRRRPELVERVINLAYIDPQPQYQPGDIMRRLSLMGMAAALLLAMAAMLQPQAILMVTLAGICLLLLGSMSARPGRWVFHTTEGGIPVCSVSRGLLRQAVARRFVELLADRADGARIILPKGNKRLAAELAEHRRMLESGFLSRRHYESARRRLLEKLRGGAEPSKVQLA